MSRKPLAARTAGPVGRDDVLAELRRVVDEAVAGRGHLLLLLAPHPGDLAALACTRRTPVTGSSSALDR